MCLYFLINFYLFYMASHQLPTRQVSIPTQKVEIKEPTIPEYFEITNEYEKVKVGHITQPVTIVNTSDYDYYILAGISEDEIFSKMLVSNLKIENGCAIDQNPRVTKNFPENLKMLKKKVSFQQNKICEDLSFFSKKFSNMFLKMDIKGDEYLWVIAQNIDCLNSFKQMVITFSQVNLNPTKQRADNKIKCFTKLKETHNIAFMNFNGIDLTITYVRKDITPSMVSKEKEERKKLMLEKMKKEESENQKFKKEDMLSKTPLDKKVNFDMNVEENHYQSIQNKALERAKMEQQFLKQNIPSINQNAQMVKENSQPPVSSEQSIVEDKQEEIEKQEKEIAAEKAKIEAEEAEKIMKAQIEQAQAEELAKKQAEEAEALMKAQIEQAQAEELAKKQAEEAEALMKAQIEQAEAEEKARIEAENAKAKEESDNKETKEEVESEEQKKLREIQEAEAMMQAQIEQAEALMAAEIAKAEAAASNTQNIDEKQENEVSQTENLELQIEETPKLELDEASSDDEEEERERERLKQQAVNQL